MESLAELLSNHTGETIEVKTNGGEQMAGLIDDVYQDYFVLSSTTRLYFVVYTGISTFFFPETPEAKQAPLDAQRSSAAAAARSSKERKATKRGKG